MPKSFFTINLEDYCRKIWANNPEERDKFLHAIASLNLSEEEESFLVKVFPPSSQDLTDTLNVYQQWVDILRNPVLAGDFWIEPAEIAKLDFGFELVQSQDFGRKVLASAFIWLRGDYPETVLAFMNKLSKLVDGDFSFAEILIPWDSFYQRLSLCLWEKYLPVMSEDYQILLLSGDLLTLFVSMDLDLDKTLRQSVLYFSSIADRRDLSVKFAALIMNNNALIGIDELGADAKISFWIDKFRQLSRGKFDILNLVEMMNDDGLWKNTDLNEKMIIKNILLVYISLVTEKYVFFDVDLGSIKSASNKPALSSAVDLKKIKEDILRDYPIDQYSSFLDLPGVLARLQSLSKDYNDPSIADLYYFDEQSNEFKWRE